MQPQMWKDGLSNKNQILILELANETHAPPKFPLSLFGKKLTSILLPHLYRGKSNLVPQNKTFLHVQEGFYCICI
jgi:hypothetical protein